MAVKDSDEIGRVALARFQELMSDMGWTEKYAADQLYEEIGVPLDIGKKAIEAWFERGGIPSAHIFNISSVFGVDAGWLAGQPHIEKEKAIRPSGFYAREVARENSRRTPPSRRTK